MYECKDKCVYNCYMCMDSVYIGVRFGKRSDARLEQKGNCSNPDSHLVSHDSTNESLPCLTLLIGREAVFSWRYGRRWDRGVVLSYIPTNLPKVGCFIHLKAYRDGHLNTTI